MKARTLQHTLLIQKGELQASRILPPELKKQRLKNTGLEMAYDIQYSPLALLATMCAGHPIWPNSKVFANAK